MLIFNDVLNEEIKIPLSLNLLKLQGLQNISHIYCTYYVDIIIFVIIIIIDDNNSNNTNKMKQPTSSPLKFSLNIGLWYSFYFVKYDYNLQSSGEYKYHLLQYVRNFPHSVFMSSICFSKIIIYIPINNINRIVFVINIDCDSCKVNNELIKLLQIRYPCIKLFFHSVNILSLFLSLN